MARNKSAQEVAALAVQKPSCTAIAKSECKLKSRAVKGPRIRNREMNITTMAIALGAIFFMGRGRKGMGHGGKKK